MNDYHIYPTLRFESQIMAIWTPGITVEDHLKGRNSTPNLEMGAWAELK